MKKGAMNFGDRIFKFILLQMQITRCIKKVERNHHFCDSVKAIRVMTSQHSLNLEIIINPEKTNLLGHPQGTTEYMCTLSFKKSQYLFYILI